MTASLMMYAHPALAGPNARYWAGIRAALAQRGIDSPERLANDAPEFAVWQDPDLVLSQTCGMPYRLWLHSKVQLVGTPDFGIKGLPPGFYASPIVVRADDPRTVLEDFRDGCFTFNQTYSQSGWAAIHTHLAPHGWWFENRSQSHGHFHSARAVAEGRADIAALDAVSWRIMREHESFSGKLRVLEWTSPTPGLPYITGPSQDVTLIRAAVSEAIDGLLPPDKTALRIKGLVQIPKQDYLAIPNPPRSAGWVDPD
ncbi:MAG: phosphate/phosphite/phosphonate ABC transporter substrate-binding protein [Sulfitobacter sp.]